jgi:hypothetical protein
VDVIEEIKNETEKSQSVVSESIQDEEEEDEDNDDDSEFKMNIDMDSEQVIPAPISIPEKI